MKICAVTPNRKLDYLTETLLEGLKKANVELIVSDCGNGVNTAVNDAQFLEEAKTADYIIAFFGKVKDNLPPKYYLLDRIDRWDSTAYVDGSEWTYTGYPALGQLLQAQKMGISSARKGEPWLNEYFLKRCFKYFKRECYESDVESNVIPLLFGFVDRMICEPAEKDIDVLCAFGQISDGLRKDAVDICNELKKETGHNIVITSNSSYEEYKKLMSRSIISIDAWGGGDCCARIWEILGNGVCCLYQDYNIHFPFKPINEKEAFSYSTRDELKNRLIYLLNNKEKALKVGEQGKELVFKHHTSLARAEYFLHMLQEKS